MLDSLSEEKQLQASPFEDLLIQYFLRNIQKEHDDKLRLLLLLLWREMKSAQTLYHDLSQAQHFFRTALQKQGVQTLLSEKLAQQLEIAFSEFLLAGESFFTTHPQSPFIWLEKQKHLYWRHNWHGKNTLQELFKQRLQTSDKYCWTVPLSVAVPGQEKLQLLEKALSTENLVMLVGGPGSGKTTLLVALLRSLYKQQPQLRVCLAAPTGRAASRMLESINRECQRSQQEGDSLLPQEAFTLHRLLGIRNNGQLRYGASRQLSYDLLVIDEASMIDIRLFNQLLAALPAASRLLLIGDPQQLPPVEPGAVLKALLKLAKRKEHPLHNALIQLEHSHRSNEQIMGFAKAVLNKDYEKFTFYWENKAEHISCQALPDQKNYCSYLTRRYLQQQPQLLKQPQKAPSLEEKSYWQEPLKECFRSMEQFSVLSPIQVGLWGVQELNRRLDVLLGRGRKNYHGRLIVITRNDYQAELANGERGIVLEIEGSFYAVFPQQNGYRFFPLTLLKEFDAAYIQTVHRSQGSEFDQIEMVLPTEAQQILSAELLYTAFTRARNSVKLYAEESLLRHLFFETE